MATHSSLEKGKTPATRAPSIKASLIVRSMEISTVATTRAELADDNVEIIDRRYAQAQALMNLESLFAEGLFNR